MTAMTNLLKNKYIKLNLILGFLMISWYIYVRFLRGRLPKDIPYIFFNEYWAFVLISLCLIYGYSIRTTLRPSKSFKIIKDFYETLLLPLKEADLLLKNKPFIKKRIPLFMFYIKKIYTKLTENGYFYYIFFIIPRLLLLGTLLIDVFYFHKIYYFYNIIILGFIMLLTRYLLYSIEKYKEELIINLESDVKYILIDDFVDPADYTDTHEEFLKECAEEYTPTMAFYDLDRFFKTYVNQIYRKNEKYPITVFTKAAFKEKILESLGLDRSIYNLKPKLQFGAIRRVADEIERLTFPIIEEIADLGLIIRRFNALKDFDGQLDDLKVLIYTNYLLIWLYILIVSIPFFHSDPFFAFILENLLESILRTAFIINNPFSDIPCIAFI